MHHIFHLTVLISVKVVILAILSIALNALLTHFPLYECMAIVYSVHILCFLLIRKYDMPLTSTSCAAKRGRLF